MTSQYRHRRSSDPTKAFTQLEPGEIAVNTANRQLALGDAASGAIGNPLTLLPLRYFDVRAKYAAGDMVYYQNVVYRSIGVSGPGAFTPGQWTMLVGTVDPQYVAKAGDVMTGLLTLSGNPSTGLQATTKQYTDAGDAARVAKAGDTMTGLLVLPATPPTLATHATNKDYVDNALANKSSVIVSDTPPAGAIDNTLWWESDSGLLYVRYNDGSSTQWTIACPQPDTTLFVQRVGDTMTGPLVLPANPTLALQAAPKQYVDATAKTWSGKNYIVNGAMMVSQENGTTGSSANNYYPVDQFVFERATSGQLGVAQQSITTPAGSPNRLYAGCTTVSSSPAASDYAIITQNIEGSRTADLMWGTANAKTVTLQFGVFAPAGTYNVSFTNHAADRSYIAPFVISPAEVGNFVVKSVTVPGDTAGVWKTDNTRGMIVRWGLMSGSTFHAAAGSWIPGNFMATSSQFNLLNSTSNVFLLCDVSLTEGTTAVPFVVPDYASELTACLRYWEKSYNYAVAKGTNTLAGAVGIAARAHNATVIGSFGTGFRFQQPKRADPTINFFCADGIPGGISYSSGGGLANAGNTTAGIGQNGVQGVLCATASGLIAGQAVDMIFHYTANARL